MIETAITFGFALLFGLGIALSVLAISLFFRVFFASNNYNRPFVIIAMAFVFLSLGMTFLFFVIV